MEEVGSQANSMVNMMIAQGIGLGKMLVGAIILYLIGKLVISMIKNMADKALSARHIDDTVKTYSMSALGVLLNILLALAILSLFGIETASFAGILAAGGVAIGMAWSGLLAHFAAGIFLLILRPFKVGDFIQSGDTIGTVVEIGLFVTAIDTMDNVRTFVGNNTIFSGKIQNFTANPHRRVERTAQLAHGVDVHDTIRRLKEKLAAIPNVKSDPAPDVEILDFNLAGTVLAVRPYCHNDDYWQVFFATNEAIVAVGGEAQLPVPNQHYKIHQLS